ncbi:MAG: adenosylcobalamin-dependent ribonucleoside-diphosphate reductase [Psychrilyobacter sp.]|uniref:adenosylcobalamin-dependent ribonucleoside-diphosphate reductase n=1 Tax=Psychrilyobacter sp. TaxID=2586924 RepID=UPI003C796E22
MNEVKWLGEENILGQDIWEKKYKYTDETFKEWLERISNGNLLLKDSIVNKEFIFAGRILANRGLHKLGRKITYSNCYVLTPPEDNLESIFETAKKLARTFSYGGGCGIDISKLRPRGTVVNNSAMETTGSVSFMDLYNLTTEIIGQNGRRGALMLSISIDHPDIQDFIGIKGDLSKVQKANISVRMTDEFMEKVKKDELFKLKFEVIDTDEIMEKEVRAKDLFKELARQNWNYAEPGMLFWDRISNWNLLSEDENFEFAGTNPCAEEPLPAGGSCLLGSLILPSFFNKAKDEFEFDRLKKAVRIGVRALNEVLDEGLPLHPLKEQRESVADWRQIGLGILGVGDLLIQMDLRYGSPESIEFCDGLGKIIITEALKESAYLAKENGAYPNFNLETILKSPFLIENSDDEVIELIKKYGLRNSQLLTIAPTGSIGTMLQMSTGIEPNFAFSYTRKTESLHGEDVFYEVFAPIAKQYMEKNDIESTEDLPESFVTAQNLDPIERLQMQATWQNRIDASISSTVNLINKTTIEEVENIYLKAWELGLKGVTVYRSGCAREGILTLGNQEEKETLELPRGKLKSIAEDTIYYPKNLRIGCGKLKVMIGYSPSANKIQDLYVIRSGSGGCEKNIQAVAIFMSGMLRLGGNLFMLEKSIEGISGCPAFARGNAVGRKLSKGDTCPLAILNILKEFESEMGLKDYEAAQAFIKQKEEKFNEETDEIFTHSTPCPECGEKLEVSGGCYSCRACGYSKCD